jgi:hypothetical protein
VGSNPAVPTEKSPRPAETLDVQARLEAAAAARGVGTSTLMRQIIEEWVEAHSGQPATDHVSELVRYLDAARRAATHLVNPAV